MEEMIPSVEDGKCCKDNVISYHKHTVALGRVYTRLFTVQAYSLLTIYITIMDNMYMLLQCVC